MDNTDLQQEQPFVKMSIDVVLTGVISKASGGDFYQGAMSALVVWLYNTGSFDPLTVIPLDFMKPIYKWFDEIFGKKPPSKFDKFTTNVGNGLKGVWNKKEIVGSGDEN